MSGNNNSTDDMREVMKLIDEYISPDVLVEQEEEFLDEVDLPEVSMFDELRDMVFKIRSYTEQSENDDYASGVEDGMQKAAEMIENFIHRHERQSYFG